MEDESKKDEGSLPAPEPGALKELVHIDPLDLHELLSTRPERLLGRIIELNRRARYHNSLDAIGLIQRLLEVRDRPSSTVLRKG